MNSSWNILLIKSHGSIELVGHNPRAASGFTHVYSVWLKCQVRDRLSILSTDIGIGFKIFRGRVRPNSCCFESCINEFSCTALKFMPLVAFLRPLCDLPLCGSSRATF
jgi:hypothetical protein